MAEFKSQIGGRKFQGNKLREFDVPDGNDEVPQFNVDEAINSGKFKKLDRDEIAEFQERLNKMNMEDVETFKPATNRQEQGQRRSQLAYEEDLREIEVARHNRKKGIERLNKGARQRIEMLLGMIRSVREADINGTKFTFQTLLGKEMREAIVLATAFDGTVESPFEIRIQFLARSISEIDGIPIDQFIGSEDIDDKLAFVSELDDIFLNRLYEEYLILTKEAKQKYSIATKAEVEEVSEDLKK